MKASKTHPLDQLTELTNLLRKHGPHGHPRFVDTVLEALRLHSTKSNDYTLGGDPLGNFQRVASILSRYPTFPWNSKEGITIVYMLKQLDTTMNSLGRDKSPKVEGLISRVLDIGVYAFILVCMLREGDRE